VIFQDKLVSIIFGMLRQNHFDFIDTYKAEAFTAIKAVMKQVILFLSITKRDKDNNV
jgi:vacuolar protein sorting-associated protein 54